MIAEACRHHEETPWRRDPSPAPQLLPALIGAFAGAPILAREMETGTFRYAWTQGFGRTRWIIAKLALVGVPLAVIAGAFGILAYWYFGPPTAPRRSPGC